MKPVRFAAGLLILAALAVGGWILVRHPDWVKGAPGEDEDAVEVAPDVPVRLGKIARATLHRHIEGFGTVESEPALPGKPPAAARVVSPASGVLAEILAAQGQRVDKGTPLVQLDDRTARAEEAKAAAALASAKAALAKLKAFPRAEQVQVARMQVERALRGVDYAQKKKTRVEQLAADQLASAKLLQEAELELLTAKNDQAIAEKQMLLLKSSPAPEEVAEAEAKVAEAEQARAAAELQRVLLRILSPVAGTVVRIRPNPGEAVDLATVLAEVVDLDRLVVEASVPAADLPSLAAGMDVEIGPGTAKGKVVFVGLDADRRTDTGLVRIALPPKSGLALGQAVRVRIAAEERKDVLAVPREALVRNPEGKDVVVGIHDDKAVLKEVHVGLKEGALVEIEGDGLHAGDDVVTQGAYGLPADAKVRVLKDE